jgi:hypothetical protein
VGIRTWPPLKPTATTPSWFGLERNLCLIVEGEVIMTLDGDDCIKNQRWRHEIIEIRSDGGKSRLKDSRRTKIVPSVSVELSQRDEHLLYCTSTATATPGKGLQFTTSVEDLCNE